LEVGLLIDTDDHLFLAQGTSVQLDQGSDQVGKVVIAGHFGREPEMVPSRFELMGAQNPPNGCGGNGLDDAVSFELASKFRTVPLGERATPGVRSFTGKFHDVEGHFR
jgi:hypothetical protein